MLVLFLAAHALAMAAPELTLGTAMRKVGQERPGWEAHFGAWSPAPEQPQAIVRSPDAPRSAPAAAVTTRPSAQPALTRPADPLTRLASTHLAQYGGDLDMLTGMDVDTVPAPDAAGQ